MTTYTGGCHCGKVRYEVDAEISSVISCNCSHCSMKGLLLTFVPIDSFRLLSGEDSLTEYRFNKKVIEHVFCKECGVQPFAYGVDKDGNRMATINIRCLDGVNIEEIPATVFDGRSY
ncbi:MAG TPA: GFA family protein [Candidatus Paceibacterota bacterium]|nr:GFA family protein [Candidatus Paceibacterota bacterium]